MCQVKKWRAVWPTMRQPRRVCCVANPRADIETLLGYIAEPEMVHRDNLVLTKA